MPKFFENFKNLFSSSTEKRSASSGLVKPMAWLFGGMTSSGVSVTKSTIIGDSAVWAALRILSNSVASLPWEVYQDDGENRTRFKTHPVDYLINKEPNKLYTSYSFRQAMIFKAFLYGDAYVQIIRNKDTAEPQQLILLNSTQVELFESSDGIYYYIVKADGINGNRPKSITVSLSDMVHIKPMTSNGVTGIDLIKTHAENLGVNIAATQYGANFFKNGAHVSGVLEMDGNLEPEQANRLRDQWKGRHSGVNNTGSTPVLESGVKYKKIGLNPSEALLVEVRKYQVEEVARIFGIPSHMLSSMDKATFNNIEVMSLDFVKNTLRPLCVMIEQEFNRKLFTEKEKRSGTLYTRFNMDALMRGATKDRFEAHAIAIQNKILSANEVRGLENWNPREGGDTYENPNITVNQPQAEPTSAE